MGDFVGGMLKYLRRHPVPRVTVAGGVAKMTKLAQGRLDLHSKRGAADMAALAALAASIGARRPSLPARIAGANTVAEAFGSRAAAGSRSATPSRPARLARRRPRCSAVRDIALEIVVFDRDGRLVGRAPFARRSRRPSAEPAA